MKNKLRSKKSSSSPVPIIVVLVLFAGICFLAIRNIDETLRILSSLKVSGMSFVRAAETPDGPGKKGDEPKVGKEEKNSAVSKSEKSHEGGTKKNWTEEEVKAFAKLEERKRELDEREEEMQRLDEELQQQKLMLEDKIKQLEKIRQNIGTVLKERTTVDSEKVDRLVEFYSNMKPQNAAKVFEELNENLAVEVLSRIKKKNAADIMNLIKADKAQRLSEKFAGYRK